MPSDVQQSFIDESALEEVEAQEEDRHSEYDPDNDTEEEDNANEVPMIAMEEANAEDLTASVTEPVEMSAAEMRRAQALDDYPAAALKRTELRAPGPTLEDRSTSTELRVGRSRSPQRRGAESQEAENLEKLNEDDETLLE